MSKKTTDAELMARGGTNETDGPAIGMRMNLALAKDAA